MNNTLTVDGRELTQELAWISRAMRAKQYIPALSAVHVSAVVGALQLRRSDYELWAETSVYADGGGQASILVDLAKLSSVLKGERGDVDISINATDPDKKGNPTASLTVTAGGRTVKLRSAANLQDYPDWPVFVSDDTGAAILSTTEITRALTSVSEDGTRPSLTGVSFQNKVMVSTDKFRLTRVTYAHCGKPMIALVPAGALRSFSRGDELVTVDRGNLAGITQEGVEGSMVHISAGQRSIIARVLDGDFPKWEQLIPTSEDAQVRVVIRRDELLAAIGADDHQITLTITDDGALQVVDRDRDGDTEVAQQLRVHSIQCADGLPFTVRFSAKNLRGCLRSVGTGVVHFEATTSHKPVIVRALGDAELHLIMPIKLPA
jgi:DNA polymerase III sliding clamp (beta) subunit (PCNA family)